MPNSNAPSVAISPIGAATALKSTIKVPSLSGIKSTLDQPKDEHEKVSVQNEVLKEYIPVTLGQLKEVWEKFVQQRKLNYKPYEIVILNQEFSLSENTITLKLSNPVQLEQLNDFKIELIAFLRKELRNYDLTIDPIVNTLEEKKNIYTSSDKFNYLAQKNPVLLKLKQRLGLDLDY